MSLNIKKLIEIKKNFTITVGLFQVYQRLVKLTDLQIRQVLRIINSLTGTQF